MKVKPKNVKVSGFPSPRSLRSFAAKRPNSIKRVVSGWSDSANSSSLSRIASRKRRASPLCSKPITRSSAYRTTIMSPRGLPPSPALSPKVEAVMQVDIGEDRRNHRSLAGSPVIDRHDPVFEDARPQPFLDQADDALVANPVFHEADQPFSADAAEEVLDVGVKYPVHLSYFDRRR